MAESVAQTITDLLIQHDIDVLRVLDASETLIEQDVRALTSLIVGELAASDPTEPIRRAFGKSRLDRVIGESQGLIRTAYSKSYRTLRRELIALGIDETEAFRAIVNQGVGVNVMGRSLNTSDVTSILDDRAITTNFDNAETMRGFFEREAAAHHRRVQGTLQQGFSQGDNLSQLIARLQEKNGIQMREAVGIARTATNHVTTNVRIEMMQRNANLFRGVIAIAVLDGNTTRICISRSNGMWSLNTGQPLPESPVRIKFPGPTPWHFAERTHLYPLTHTASQMARRSEQARRAISRLTPEQRALLNADPPAQEDYGTWLKRQPESVQVRVLGRTRRELWLQDKLSLRELVTQKGRPLTLKQLAQRRKRAA